VQEVFQKFSNVFNNLQPYCVHQLAGMPGKPFDPTNRFFLEAK
jgi:hypothetical protein